MCFEIDVKHLDPLHDTSTSPCKARMPGKLMACLAVPMMAHTQERAGQLRLPGNRPPDAPTQLLVLPIFAALSPEQQMKVRAVASAAIEGAQHSVRTGVVQPLLRNPTPRLAPK
jgi:hypothetical protein